MPGHSFIPRTTRRGLVPALVLGLAVAGCASTAQPSGGRGQIDSPLTTKNNHLKCLQDAHLPVRQVGATWLQIGALPGGPTIMFAPTPGSAQSYQIQAVRSAQGAEIIGQALVYPHQASDGEMKEIETCVAKGVSG